MDQFARSHVRSFVFVGLPAATSLMAAVNAFSFAIGTHAFGTISTLSDTQRLCWFFLSCALFGGSVSTLTMNLSRR